MVDEVYAFVVMLIALLFFIGVLIRNIYKFNTVKKSLKEYYLWAILTSGILILTVLLYLLGYWFIAVVLFLIVLILSFIRYGASLQAQREETKEIIAKVKHQKLSLLDLFTRSGWIKLRIHLGLANALAIIFVTTFVVTLIILFFVGLIFSTSFLEIIAYSFVLAIVLTINYYLTLRKLKI